MIRRSHAAAALLWALLALLGWTAPAAAQGVTTSAVAGRVTNEQGEPIQGVTVTVTNTRTGAEYRAVTRADGRFQLQGLQPGGPYRVQAAGLGLATQTRANLQLALSQTEQVDFTLAPQAVLLETVAVTAEDEGAVISPGRTGTATVISDSALMRLPTITRDFTDFVRLVPQISSSGSGTSGAGRNFRFNSIQIDGAANNDLFGLASSGTPGGQAGTKAITLEAIQEVQVVLAPYDVRQGGFTGAGINAVTRSGTNDWEGSFAFFGRSEGLVGNYQYDRAGNTIRSSDFSEFKQNELAFSLGGPIMRDRAFFFVAGEMARREAPNGTFITRNGDGSFTTVGSATISGARVDSVATILRDQYGYDPGTYEELNLRRESNNVFARFDLNLGTNNRLTLRHNYVDAFDDNFGRSDAAFSLGNAGYVFNSTTNATVGQLNSTLGNQFFNEFRVGYTTVRDNREVPNTLFPRVEVDLPAGSCPGTSGTCRIIAGSENFSVANELDQDVLEITNDLSFSRGVHNITVGTHNEFFSFSNLFARNLYGLYRFANIAALRAGTPNRFEYSFFNQNVEGARPRAEFSVRQLSFYLQDRLSLSSRLTVTPGLRWDLTQFPDNPGRNPAFETSFQAAYTAAGLGTFGRRTDEVPENTWLFNPRVGFNWDVLGNQTTQVRGGVGLFSGRTPYVWVSNAYGNTGLDYTRFTCTGTTTRPPAFRADPNNQPQACVNAAGQPLPVSALANEINTIDPDFKLPQVLRYSLAVDQRLPFGLYGTLEALYTDSRSDPVYRDLTVIPRANTTVEGRQAYQRISATGFGNVYDVYNTDENYSYSLTAQLQRPFLNGWEASLAYTFSRSEDVNGLTSSQASSNYRFNPIDNNPNDPALRTGLNDVPHRIVGSFTKQFEWARRAPTDFSLIYVGESGRPYSYTYNGDVNGDGQDANDLVYVPASADQVRFEGVGQNNPFTPEASWANLNAFIESVDCLREARGTVIKRNACRLPWSNRFDVRIAQTLPTFRGQGAQLTVDILNFANLLNDEWGLSEFVPNQADQALRVVNTTAVNGRVQMGGFGPRTSPFTVSDLGSRYQIAAGIRYTF